ncbi:uncharacterized protein [Ptychodera flava]|uniref:uncharacterized protein n=1 Tax=Ptychodera flava TaxID=63121 RepID=UPI00396A7B7B
MMLYMCHFCSKKKQVQAHPVIHQHNSLVIQHYHKKCPITHQLYLIIAQDQQEKERHYLNHLPILLRNWVVGLVVVNEHSWALTYAQDVSECYHGPLAESEDRDKEWLIHGSAAHNALMKIALNKQFLSKVPQYINYRYHRHFNQKVTDGVHIRRRVQNLPTYY